MPKIIHVRIRPLPLNHIPTSISKSQSSNSSSRNVIIKNHDHRDLKTKTKRKLRKYIFACGILLILVLIATITSILLTKMKQNISRTNRPAVLRWKTEDITIAGITNVSGVAANQLNYPYDLVVDWSYALYVADSVNNRVQKFSKGSLNGVTVAGKADGSSGISDDSFNSANFLLVDDDSNMYVTDSKNHRIMYWKKNAAQGVVVAGTGITGNSSNELNFPHGLAYDQSSKTLFISDYGNNRVMKYLYNSLSGIVVGGNITAGTSRTQLSKPHGLFFESSSNSILIANTGANNTVRWTMNDIQWSIIIGDSNGGGGNSSSSLFFPTDIMLDPMDNMYIVDRYNHRVQFFSVDQLNGTTIAGQSGQSGVNSTSLCFPNAVTLDNQLNLYVADWRNHRIQKFLRY